MSAPFSFQGRIRPLPYALSALGVLLAQYLAVAAAYRFVGRGVSLDWAFVVAPFWSVVALDLGYRGYDLVELLLLVLMLVVAWIQAALAFRRAADAGQSGWLAAPVIAPALQLPVVLVLCVLPSRAAAPAPRDGDDAPLPDRAWQAAALGVIAAMGLTLFAVAVGALAFGTYGYGLFVLSPFLVGAITGYFANRTGDLGGARTVRLVVVAATLGGIALVLVALEGLFCLIMAAPLAYGIAVLGGVFGRAVAIRTHGSAAHALVAVGLLPLVFASEQALPVATTFHTEQAIEIAAPPAAVWRALVRMDTIAAPPALPFRLGVAYPIRGDVLGEGVGATRIGVFSTGVALERVVAWQPERRLAFEVLSDPPALRELSLYEHVHAPHVTGYFRTTYTSFALEPLAGGRTRVVEQTVHDLRLDPLLYWLPLARWVVGLNNARVLAHLREQAERSVAARSTS